MNPNNMIKQFVINTIAKNGNPMLSQLIQMAQNGNTQGVEQFARNLYQQQGKDFDKEFQAFQQMFLKK